MRLLDHLVQRLYAGLSTGPAIHCRPHRSRARLDLAQIAACCGTTPAAILAAVLGPERKVSLDFDLGATPAKATAASSADERAAWTDWQTRQATLRKLVVIADDARTYAQDTGAHALQIGLPILSLPPRAPANDRRNLDKRVLAPIAFVPCSVVVRAGRRPGIDLACQGDGIDRVIPNEALLAWLGQQTGKRLAVEFADDEGEAPWREVAELVELVRGALELPAVPTLDPDAETVDRAVWGPLPRTEDAVVPGILTGAVLGLFPRTHQALLDDLEAMAAGEVPLVGPVLHFTRVDVEHPAPRSGQAVVSASRSTRATRLVCTADPCQARAVDLARTAQALVVHGPPGTGKSQTIANIIGDHLARGERVLFVCDKRTALDVVHHRLDHLGLGSLCAVVHDAQRDQKDLYRDVRDQLEALTDANGDPRALAELALRDAELDRLHAELSAHARAVSEPAPGGPSFHAMCGEWLGIAPGHPAAETIEGVQPEEMIAAHKHVLEVLARAADPSLMRSPWGGVVALSLEAFLAAPQEHWLARLEALAAATARVDAVPLTLGLTLGGPGGPQAAGAARARWAEGFAAHTTALRWEQLVPWIGADAAARARVRAELDAAASSIAAAAAPLDPQLLALHRATPWDLRAIAAGLAALGEYLAASDRWWSFLRFGANAAAREVVAKLGLALSPDAARTAKQFLEQLRARVVVRALYDDTLGARGLATPDDAVLPSIAAIRGVVLAMDALDADPELRDDAATIRSAVLEPAAGAGMLAALRSAAVTGGAIAAWADLATRSEMFTADAIAAAVATQCRGGSVDVRAWIDGLPQLEGVLRLEAATAQLPAPLRPAVAALAEAKVGPEAGWTLLRRGVLAGTMASRLREDPALLGFDGDKLAAYHARWAILDRERLGLVRDAVLLKWITRQRERLLAQTGSRLSSLGAELKRRLALRGERVMRLRQVIAAGAATEGGDPIFDLRPVWMASPETAAQIFGRAPAFDVIVFDEASQCRLEHALPVLLRGHRVVIAGDPKQLPPTRFFETAASTDVEIDDAAGDQALFETQQAGIEDLLAAALDLEVEQCYLDVHYRSTNADLIGYSNAHFYDGRLQAIPNLPGATATRAPVELVQVPGIYEDNVNPTEAAKVVEIVRGLLARPEPPSIGIACFNLSQRDVILEALDDAAAADDDFAQRLEAARSRRGEGSFEGLFVKNLENVQGDERDHLIISTTYGPNPAGKFYRRFGPLGQQGGGRRLNVLITRAREHVHLVTSIPREVWLAEVEVPPGQVPSGGLLLLGYLRWAEALAARDATGDAEHGGASVVVRPSPTGSPLAAAMGDRVAPLVDRPVGVHYGNEGFCVDLAVLRPDGGAPLGVLCDGSRFDRVADRVEWDVFRTGILAAHGWSLLRVTSPQVFRDAPGTTRSIAAAATGPA